MLLPEITAPLQAALFWKMLTNTIKEFLHFALLHSLTSDPGVSAHLAAQKVLNVTEGSKARK